MLLFLGGMVLGILIGAFAVSKRLRRKLWNAIKAMQHNEDDDLYHSDEEDE